MTLILVRLLAGAKSAIEKIKEYVDRAQVLKKNADEAISRGELDKASEFLWGIVSCYLNGLKLLRTGKPASNHRELVRVAEDVEKVLADERFSTAMRNAEKLHANFYHMFLSTRDLAQLYREIMYALKRLHELLYREAKHLLT